VDLKSKRFDAIIVGEINIDLVLWRVPMPEYEKEQLAEEMRFTMGSSSAITAHNLAALGARVAFVGKAGDDIFGHYMTEQLRAAGVDTSHIIMDPTLKTGATIVLANPPRKALLTYLGASATSSWRISIGISSLQGIISISAAFFSRPASGGRSGSSSAVPGSWA